jgi:gamma-glutamyltranspeptidase/glutathione hydrolase
VTEVEAETAWKQACALRLEASGSLGTVACGSQIAAGHGISALLAGGNCVDAALAAALAEVVTLPPKCGLAGDVVALYLPPGGRAPEALLAIGGAAAALAQNVEAARELPVTGGLSIGVPGAPSGYAALAAKGRLGLKAPCRAAAGLARRGVVWSAQCAVLAAEADQLLRTYQPQGCVYRPAGGPLTAGDHVRLPGLADLLDAFACAGADLFAGPAGEELVAAAVRAGGVIDADDLCSVRAEWTAAPSTAVAEQQVWTTPAPTYGPVLLRVLAGASRPVGPDAMATAVQHGRLGGEGTSVVAAADADGGAVVVVHSNSFPRFGSGVVVEAFDLVLSNRAGRGFSADRRRPNFPAPGRRPLTTLHAWALGPDAPRLLGATPGGEQQVPWNVQVLDHLLRRVGPGEALAAPKWRLEASGAVVEPGAPARGIAVPPLSMRSAHVLVAPVMDGVARAWADPRSETVALAA